MPAVILFLSANPAGTRPLALDEEYRAIDHAKTAARLRDAFDLRAVLAATIDDVRDKLAELRPTVVHFAGHGLGSAEAPGSVRDLSAVPAAVKPVRGELALKGPDGRAAPVPIAPLAELFGLHGGAVRCVVLNACNSLAQAQAIAAHVDCAIGTTRPVTDAAAIAFAKAFHRRLCDGGTFQEAFDAGGNNVELARADEKDVFALCPRVPGTSEHLRLAEPGRARSRVPFGLAAAATVGLAAVAAQGLCGGGRAPAGPSLTIVPAPALVPFMNLALQGAPDDCQKGPAGDPKSCQGARYCITIEGVSTFPLPRHGAFFGAAQAANAAPGPARCGPAPDPRWKVVVLAKTSGSEAEYIACRPPPCVDEGDHHTCTVSRDLCP
jgi:hypothetical protein